MKKDPLLKKKQFWADIVFKNLTSLTRSEDISLNFYGMKLEEQNATEQGFKDFSWLFASYYIEKRYELKKKNKKITETKNEQLIEKSFEEGWRLYNEQKNK